MRPDALPLILLSCYLFITQPLIHVFHIRTRLSSSPNEVFQRIEADVSPPWRDILTMLLSDISKRQYQDKVPHLSLLDPVWQGCLPVRRSFARAIEVTL
ncbi:hypothetical protein GGR58DRAFT_466660 [Xylaria digitata]|nr:hypothetical protein GGR58DRAFT_466660 [Xylaria digitata]